MTLPAHQLHAAAPSSVRRFAAWLGLDVSAVGDTELILDVLTELAERRRYELGIQLGPKESLRARYARRVEGR